MNNLNAHPLPARPLAGVVPKRDGWVRGHGLIATGTADGENSSLFKAGPERVVSSRQITFVSCKVSILATSRNLIYY